MKNSVKLFSVNFIFAALSGCLLLLSVQIGAAQKSAPTPSPTPKKTDSSKLPDNFDIFSKTPPSAADKAKADKAFDGLNYFLASVDVKAAEDLIVQGYFDAARQKLDAIIKAEPKNADAYAARAMLVYEKDSLRFWQTEKSILESAKPDAEKAIELDPHNALAHYVLGAIYNEDFLLDEETADEEKYALLYADQAVAKNPNDPESYYIRGRMQSSAKAAADFTKAISLDPKFGRAYQKRGETYSLDADYYNALADFHRAMAISPKSISAYRERAKVYYYLGEIDKASADLRRALEFDPKNEHLAESLKSYNKTGQRCEYSSALQIFQARIRQIKHCLRTAKEKI